MLRYYFYLTFLLCICFVLRCTAAPTAVTGASSTCQDTATILEAMALVGPSGLFLEESWQPASTLEHCIDACCQHETCNSVSFESKDDDNFSCFLYICDDLQSCEEQSVPTDNVRSALMRRESSTGAEAEQTTQGHNDDDTTARATDDQDYVDDDDDDVDDGNVDDDDVKDDDVADAEDYGDDDDDNDVDDNGDHVDDDEDYVYNDDGDEYVEDNDDDYTGDADPFTSSVPNQNDETTSLSNEDEATTEDLDYNPNEQQQTTITDTTADEEESTGTSTKATTTTETTGGSTTVNDDYYSDETNDDAIYGGDDDDDDDEEYDEFIKDRLMLRQDNVDTNENGGEYLAQGEDGLLSYYWTSESGEGRAGPIFFTICGLVLFAGLIGLMIYFLKKDHERIEYSRLQ